MVATLGTEASLSFCSLLGVIWYTSGRPTAAQDSPLINLTRPGAAVNIRAIPLVVSAQCTSYVYQDNLLSMMSGAYPLARLLR